MKREKVYVYVHVLNENEDDIDSMLILLSIMMTISCSRCECEIGFSCKNKQKTNEKRSMLNDTSNNVMLISVNGPDMAELDIVWKAQSNQQQKNQNISNEM